MSQVNPDRPGRQAAKIEPVGSHGRPSKRFGAYLRRLREGYGYTLRKVEERATALGEVIDNSQLSRFEKGKAFPSFEKLRALARIFNVSVQNFSDVLDLEEFESFRPSASDFDGLLREGADLYASGEHGRAFVTYERAFELAVSRGDDAVGTAERIVEARWRMAAALKALGKLSMTEHELREILKLRQKLGRWTRIRTLLQLVNLYRELGDFYLASVLSRDCLDLAAEEGDLLTQASILNTLANIYQDEGDGEKAIPYYDRALSILNEIGGHDEMRAKVLTNLGGCLVMMQRTDQGVARIQQAYSMARRKGFRRVAALSLTRLAEAHLQRGNPDRAAEVLSESDAVASKGEETYQDILFLNAYRRWELARGSGNGTREKIAFGRLRHLRSLLERKFPEVDEFDRYIEQNRRKHERAQ